RPCLAAIRRFPQAAARRTEVADVRLPLDAGDGQRASTARRSETAPLVRLEDRGINGDGAGRLGIGPAVQSEATGQGDADESEGPDRDTKGTRHFGTLLLEVGVYRKEGRV